ncbi:hypothetical protein AB0O01_35525 [Streptomyces sp. NPDC093252]|uniref:terpene synthase family protein n=1 Tax=Streptomyces sp. NPDC093252 TaxID=3154980 RepID=UPI0034201514
MASRFYPDATGADLDLGVDLMSWFFAFDDLFDGPSGTDPAGAQALVCSTMEVLRRPARRSAVPVVRAFSDLWRRSGEGMSSSWRHRAAGHWRAYLQGYVTEAVHRHRDVMLTVEEHLRLRRETIGVLPTVDLAERIGRFEVPGPIHASSWAAEMLAIAAEVDTIHNDLCSAEKEEARGGIHNLLVILERAGTPHPRRGRGGDAPDDPFPYGAVPRARTPAARCTHGRSSGPAPRRPPLPDLRRQPGTRSVARIVRVRVID